MHSTGVTASAVVFWVICQAACGGDSASTLFRFGAEPAGANCPAGGVFIESGLDGDGDGQLDDDEVQSTEYICNGEDGGDGQDGQDGSNGHAILAETNGEPPGANCERGGTRVDVGLDLDDDQILDPEEITRTFYVCDGGPDVGSVIEGHYEIRNSLDAALLAGVQEITGSLSITAPGLSSLSLPDLVTVGGGVFFIDSTMTLFNPDLVTVSMPALTSIGDGLYVIGCPKLQVLDLPSLTAVRWVEIRGTELTDVDDLAGLSSTEWIRLDGLEQLTSIDGLAGAGAGTIDLRALPLIDDIAPAVAGLAPGGGLTLYLLPLVTDLSPMAGLTSMAILAIQSCDGVTTIDLPLLTETNYGGIYLIDNPQLTRLAMPALTTMPYGSELFVTGNAQLPMCHATEIRDRLQANFWTGTAVITGGWPCWPITWCRLQYPVDVTVSSGSPVGFYGRLYINGLTEMTNGVDEAFTVKAAVGFGADNTDPATHASWTWTPAAANPYWDAAAAGEPNNDEYAAAYAPPAPGSFDFAFRFSGDGGRTWTYCDSNGSQDGYQGSWAGNLTVY